MLIMAFKIDFALQFVLIQIALIGYAIYLFAVKPYTYWADARVDYFNTSTLVFIQVTFVLTSPYVTDTSVRF